MCCCTVRRVGLRISALQAGQAGFVHGVARSSGWAASEQRVWPDWMVDAHAARAEPIGPGRDVRAEHKLELPKLRATGSGGPYTAQCGLPYGTLWQVWARTYYLTPWTNPAWPACRAEIRKPTRRTVQQHTPTFLCSTKYYGPIHSAPRGPVRKVIAILVCT